MRRADVTSGATPKDFEINVRSYYQDDKYRGGKPNNIQERSPPGPKIDRPFLEYVWTWLVQHPDITLGDQGQFSNITLTEAEASYANRKSNAQSRSTVDVTGSATITEASLAREGHNKEMQAPSAGQEQRGNLSGSSLQDEEQPTVSLSSRTDSSEIIGSSHTAEKDAEKLAPLTNVRIFASENRMWRALTGHGPDNARVKVFDFDILSLVATRGPRGMLQHDLVNRSGQDRRSLPHRADRLAADGYVKKMPIEILVDVDSRFPRAMNTSIIVLRRFADTPEFLCELKRLRAPLDSRRSMKEKRRRPQPKKGTARDVAKDDELAEEAISNVEAGSADMAENDAPTLPCQWTPDRPTNNQIFDLVNRSGTQGITIPEIRDILFGHEYKKPIESYTSRLVDAWQLSQPLHLRHLAVVRDTVLRGKSPVYIHYTFHHFRSLTDQGLASWDAVTTLSSDSRHSELDVDALHQLDEYGFPVLDSSAFQGSNNDATLSECAGRYPQSKYKVGEAQPGVGRPPVQKRTQRKQILRIEAEASEPIDETLIKRDTVVRGGRGRPRKHANFEVPPNLATMPMKEIRKVYNSQRMAGQYQQKKLANEIDRRIGLGQNASDVAKEVLQESDDIVRTTGTNPIDPHARAYILQKYAGGPPPGQTKFDIALENLGIVKRGKIFTKPRVQRTPNKRQPPYFPSIAAHTFPIPPKRKRISGKVNLGPKTPCVSTRGVKVKIPEELLQGDASEDVESPISEEISLAPYTEVQSPALAASCTSFTSPLALQSDEQPTTIDKITKPYPTKSAPAKYNPKSLEDRYQEQLEHLPRPHYGFFSAESAMMIRRRKKGDLISLPAIKYKIGVFKLPQLKTEDWMSPTNRSHEMSSHSADHLNSSVYGGLSMPPRSSHTDVTTLVDPTSESAGIEFVTQARPVLCTMPSSTPVLLDPQPGVVSEVGASPRNEDFTIRNGGFTYDVSTTVGKKRRHTSLASASSEREASPPNKQARSQRLGFPTNTGRSSSVPLGDVSRSKTGIQHLLSARAERKQPQDRHSMDFGLPATPSQSIMTSVSIPPRVGQDDLNVEHVDITGALERDTPNQIVASPDEVHIASQTPRDSDQTSSQLSLWVSFRVNAELFKSTSSYGTPRQSQKDQQKVSASLQTPPRHDSAARSSNPDENSRSGDFSVGGIVAKKIRRTGGTMAMIRKDIILFLIRKCGGIGPGMPTLALPYAAEWARRGQPGTPERHTMSNAIKGLCDAGKLRQLQFAHQSKHGLRKTSSMLALPDISPSDPRVQRMQENVIHTWWKNYYPEEWLIKLDEEGRPIVTEQEKPGNGNRVPDWTNSEAYQRLLAVTLELRRLAKKKQHDLERLKVLIARDRATLGVGAKRPYHRKSIHLLSKTARKLLFKSGMEISQSKPSLSGVFSDPVFQDPMTTAWQTRSGIFATARGRSPPLRKPPLRVPPLLSLQRRKRDTWDEDQEIDDDDDLEGSSSGSDSSSDSSGTSDDDEGPYNDVFNELYPHPETETSQEQYISSQTDPEQLLYQATGTIATDPDGFSLSQLRSTKPNLQSTLSLPQVSRGAASMRRARFGLSDPKLLRHALSGTFGTLYVPTISKKRSRIRPALPSFMNPMNSMHVPTGTFSASFTGLAYGKKKLSWDSRLPHHVAESEYDNFNPTHFTYEVDRLKRLELNNPAIIDLRFPHWTFINHVFLHDHVGTFTGQIQTVGWREYFVKQGSGSLVSNGRKRYPNRGKTDIVTLLSTGGERYKQRKLLHSADGTKAEWDSVRDLKRRQGDDVALAALKQPKWRRIKGPRDTREFTKSEEHQLCYAVVAVRCLAGGVDMQIDWSLVEQVFYPNRSEELLHYKWNVVQAKYRVGLDKLENDFQDAYVEAYAEGKVAPIDYDDLEAYDWKGLVAWMKGVIPPPAQTVPDENIVSQGGNIGAETDLSDFYDIDLGLPTHRRLKLFNHSAWTSPLDKQAPDKKPTDSKRILEVAKTWVRATVIAAPETYNPDLAAKTLLSLSEQTIEAAVASLNADKVLAGRRKTNDNPDQPHFHLHPATMGKLNQAIRPPDLHRAAAFKQYLDTALLSSSSEEGGNKTLDFSPHAHNGDTIVLLNLLTAGHLTFRPKNIPTNKFGYTDSGYQTRQMNKRNLFCDVAIARTASYVPGNPIAQRLAIVPPPAKHLNPDVVATGEKCRIPLWYDIHGNFVARMWDLALAAVLSVVVLRPGVGVREVEMTVRPMLSRWEVEWVFGWLCDVGVGRVVGDDDDDLIGGEEAVRRGRWEVGEWWWLVMADRSGGAGMDGRIAGW